MMRVGGNGRHAVRRQLRKRCERHSRYAGIVERMRLIAHQRQSHERSISRPVQKVDREIGEPLPAFRVELRLEADDVDSSGLTVRDAGARLLEGDAEVRRHSRDCVTRWGGAGHSAEVAHSSSILRYCASPPGSEEFFFVHA